MDGLSKIDGAILGGMIGDALGGSLEFMSREDVKVKLKEYKNFKDGLVGKGPFNLAPGQFTDDTEMTLAVMTTLIGGRNYSATEAAHAYHQWYLSNPFDIGNTTKNAVCKQNLTAMLSAAKELNYQSLSNGFLMRLYGLVAMYYKKPYDLFIHAVQSDTELTHSNPEAKRIAIIYALMLRGAIIGIPADRIYKWCHEKKSYSKLLASICRAVETNSDRFIYEDKIYKLSQIADTNIGFVGYALWLTLIAILRYDSYQNAILDTVSYGGDTDTNACIVGAIMGALYPDTIPKKWIESVIKCKSDRFARYPLANPELWTNWLSVGFKNPS